MSQPSVHDQIAAHRLLPVIAIPDAAAADPLADALVAGGLPVAEVTLRTDAGLASIEAMAKRDDLLVGAGTVLTVDQAERAAGAGAKFIVAPGTSPAVIEWCLKHDLPIYPGVATPSEITQAITLGIDVVKFFPAEALGGIKTLKAFAAPFGGVKFVPTGGVSTANVADYLAVPAVLACGGSWMVKKDWLAEGRFDEVERVTREAVQAVAAG
ncbi:MAG: bifunctional 4-hydroxy-2-oxoglutarate aldolase/2-dehydro-3-deoxy-phosphogluconate aldolase [Planctomycetota bacterium]